MMQIKDNERLRKRFGSDFPDLRDLADNTSLIFVNQHFSFSGSRPLPVNVVEIGGIHIKQSRKSLPDDLQQLLDSAEHGVIYISWGSIINSQGMSLNKKREIVEAFKRLPQTILWKWQNDSLTATAKNVHIRDWMPQIDILCHPNVKVFMSHGGMMGTSEAVYCQKPTIVTPIYGDQYLNGAALEQRGMGIVLHYNQLTRDSIVEAVEEILRPRLVLLWLALECRSVEFMRKIKVFFDQFL
jgi:glucuronosyltransferase